VKPSPKWRRPALPENELLASLWMQAGCPHKLIVKMKGKYVLLIDGLVETEGVRSTQEEIARPEPS
jgi:hypothetical protein